MSDTTPDRQPSGSPSGGQFAPGRRQESTVDLPGFAVQSSQEAAQHYTDAVQLAQHIAARGRFAVVEIVQVDDVGERSIGEQVTVHSFDQAEGVGDFMTENGFVMADMEDRAEADPAFDEERQATTWRSVRFFDPEGSEGGVES